VHGESVWKQKKGHFRLCSSKAGTWIVANGSPKESSFEEPSNVALHCERPHRGLMPDKVSGPWSRLDGEKLVEDDTIKATTIVVKPAKLHIATPHGQQKCGGEYILVPNESANNQPLWKQMGGKYWLYSGTNGMWILGSSGAKLKNFECSRGVIYSATPHGGLMPNKVGGSWLRLDGEQFIEDADISVSV
ncbi:unnamed protein product, partial [Polarella glacialis]